MQSGAEDRRERHYRLTHAGLDAVARATPLWRGVQGKMERELSGAGGRSTESALGLLSTLSTIASGVAE